MKNILAKINPEIKKNYWLEVSTSRILIVVVLISLVAGIVILSTDTKTSFRLARNMQILGMSGYVFFILLWGLRNASNAISEELNNRTWDFQRMTPVRPSTLAIGKLFGSTVFNWFGGGICILIYLIASFFSEQVFIDLQYGVMMLFVGLFGHSIVIALSLIGIEKFRNQRKARTGLYYLIGLLASLYLGYKAFEITLAKVDYVNWFNITFTQNTFAIITILFFALWAVFALYRNMRKELQFINGPWGWLAFVFSIMLFVAGFASETKEINFSSYWIVGIYLAFFAAIITTYIMALLEPKEMVMFRQLIALFKQKKFKQFFNKLPAWLLSLTVVLLFIPLLIVASIILNNTIIPGSWQRYVGEQIGIHSIIFPITILFFIVRDLAIMSIVNITFKKGRKDFTVMVLLFILYGVLPFFVNSITNDALPHMFLPIPDETMLSIILVTPQVIIALILLVVVWKNNRSKYDKINESITSA